MTDIPIEILEIRWALEELEKDEWRKYTRCNSLLGDDGAVGTIRRLLEKTQGETHSSGVLTMGIAMSVVQSVSELWSERVEFESRWPKEVLDVNTHLMQQFLCIAAQAMKLLRTSISDD